MPHHVRNDFALLPIFTSRKTGFSFSIYLLFRFLELFSCLSDSLLFNRTEETSLSMPHPMKSVKKWRSIDLLFLPPPPHHPPPRRLLPAAFTPQTIIIPFPEKKAERECRTADCRREHCPLSLSSICFLINANKENFSSVFLQEISINRVFFSVFYIIFVIVIAACRDTESSRDLPTPWIFLRAICIKKEEFLNKELLLCKNKSKENCLAFCLRPIRRYRFEKGISICAAFFGDQWTIVRKRKDK